MAISLLEALRCKVMKTKRANMFQLKKDVTLEFLANELNLPFKGDGAARVSNVAPFSHRTKDSLTYYKHETIEDKNNIIIASEIAENCNGISCEAPRLVFIQALELLDKMVGFKQIQSEPDIDKSVKLGPNVVIGRNVKIGQNTIIEPNVVILDNTSIGSHCLIRANSTIASDGFGYERLADGTPVKFIHLGGVVIGDNVEIGANTCIARGTLGDTIIENNVKIDNLVHVAHNCIIKNGAYIIACAELSGGVVVGENAWIAPNASIKQQLKIGREATVGLSAVVTKDVAEGDVVAGSPARSLRK